MSYVTINLIQFESLLRAPKATQRKIANYKGNQKH